MAKQTKEQLKDYLSKCVVVVTFNKVSDGSERVMLCTLDPHRMPPVDTNKAKSTRKYQEKPDVLAVWDLEAKGWRAFNVDKVTKVQVGL